MIDKILPYYLKELSAVRHSAKEFAKAYPKIASYLNLESEELGDPHVARLIESFAFLTAHIHSRLDDNFSDFTDALLSVLYPHYQAPIPSFSIAKFQTKPELTEGYYLPKNTLLDSEVINDTVCKFSTAYPTTIWPITIENISYSGLPLPQKLTGIPDGIKAAISITLTCCDKELSFAKLAPDKLNFFLNCPLRDGYILYELIFNHALGFSIADSFADKDSVFLDRSHIRNKGFEKDNNLLPYSGRTALGYRLLTEFFCFPQKFLFFELTGLGIETLKNIGNKLEIIIYFNTYNKEFEQNVDAATFKLGCAPIVNLFEQTAEPIKPDHKSSDYQVIADTRQASTMEVYSVKQVSAITEKGDEVQYLPFYGIQHNLQPSSNYWCAKRKARITGTVTNRISDVYLSFVDLDFKPQLNLEHKVVNVSTYCTNNYMPSLIPFSTNSVHLRLASGSEAIAAITCLLPFTKTIHHSLEGDAQWKVISHLLLNHFSITGKEKGIEVLKEMLRLYDIKNYVGDHNSIIDCLVSINSRRISARSPEGFVNACCNGIEVALEVDESKCVGYGLFLFAQVLERFLAEYVSINSFVKLSMKSLQKDGALYKWKPQAGEKNLL